MPQYWFCELGVGEGLLVLVLVTEIVLEGTTEGISVMLGDMVVAMTRLMLEVGAKVVGPGVGDGVPVVSTGLEIAEERVKVVKVREGPVKLLGWTMMEPVDAVVVVVVLSTDSLELVEDSSTGAELVEDWVNSRELVEVPMAAELFELVEDST